MLRPDRTDWLLSVRGSGLADTRVLLNCSIRIRSNSFHVVNTTTCRSCDASASTSACHPCRKRESSSPSTHCLFQNRIDHAVGALLLLSCFFFSYFTQYAFRCRHLLPLSLSLFIILSLFLSLILSLLLRLDNTMRTPARCVPKLQE